MQNFFFLIAPILFLRYEESVCPLIFKYNKVYFVSSLITKPDLDITCIILCFLLGLQIYIMLVCTKL